ncbi:hypothetical protein PHJA_001802000 [Phtheirospermum japonicum]|uniref:Uncharacterized protein n=1 Tax=Phtheirospermum japonicum TaxID=374723 RepID=A0A830CBK8_9LAMI|nr:hypothetical protein PHJA_001802000 [Phtheirospermum japonicum]
MIQRPLLLDEKSPSSDPSSASTTAVSPEIVAAVSPKIGTAAGLIQFKISKEKKDPSSSVDASFEISRASAWRIETGDWLFELAEMIQGQSGMMVSVEQALSMGWISVIDTVDLRRCRSSVLD